MSDRGRQAGTGHASTLVAAGILLSRVSGLVRERAIGHFLGTGLAVEAFRAALRIPNLLQNLLGDGVLSASFIPSYARLLDEDRTRAGQLAGTVAAALVVVAATLSTVGIVFARPITQVLTPGWSGQRLDLTVQLVRIVTPGMGLLVLSAWALGVLNSHRRFFVSYVAPVLWNGAIVGLLIGAAITGATGVGLAEALAWGTLLGGALQLLVQLAAIRGTAVDGLRVARSALSDVRTVARRALPVIGGRGVVQLMSYLSLVLASFLAAGAVASLTYAQVLYVLPVSLFGMSVAAAELPELSRSVDRPADELRARLAAGLERIAFFSIPTVVFYVVLGRSVVSLLYGSGRFDAADVVQVWAVLAAYSIGLVATTQARLLQSGLYALGDTRTPAVIAVVRVVVAAGLGVVLMAQFDQFVVSASEIALVGPLPAGVAASPLRLAPENLHRLGAVGLALAAGLSGWLELALLRRALARRVGRLAQGAGVRSIRARCWVSAGAASAMGVVIGGMDFVASGPGLAAATLTVAGGTYLVVAWWLRVPHAARLVHRLARPW